MTVLSDVRGLPVTAGSASEIASVDGFIGHLLRMDRGAESILEDAKTFPETPLVQLCAAAFCLFGQTRTADQAGIGYLKAAEPMLVYSTEREQWLHRALTLPGAGRAICWPRRSRSFSTMFLANSMRGRASCGT